MIIDLEATVPSDVRLINEKKNLKVSSNKKSDKSFFFNQTHY